MSGERAQIVGWIFWGILTAGAGLSCFGLARSVFRFRQWKKATAELAGEIMLGDQALKVGQSFTLRRYNQEASNTQEVRGEIRAIHKKTLTLTLESASKRLVTGNSEAASFWLPVGATVVVTVTGETALYRFSARIGDSCADPLNAGQSLLTLPRPLWLGRVQRRQNVRVAMPIPATFERATDFTTEEGRLLRAKPAQANAHLPLHGAVVDLSAGGLLAEVGSALGAKEAARLVEAFVPGTIVRVRLPLPALSEALLLARVRVCERVAARGGLGVRLACQFLPMPSWEQEMLIHHIFRAQKEQLQTRFGPPASSPPTNALRS